MISLKVARVRRFSRKTHYFVDSNLKGGLGTGNRNSVLYLKGKWFHPGTVRGKNDALYQFLTIPELVLTFVLPNTKVVDCIRSRFNSYRPRRESVWENLDLGHELHSVKT